MSQKYWDEFYSKFNNNLYSDFFRRVNSELNINNTFSRHGTNCTILDLGCGNGRDTKELSYWGKVIACDFSKEALNSPNVYNYAEKIININISREFPAVSDIDYVYSRFFLHCFPPKRQKEILKWALNTARLGCFFECRAYDTDALFYYPESVRHKRYLVKPENIIYVMNGFPNIYYQLTQSKNLAQYKNENPLILRLITWK